MQIIKNEKSQNCVNSIICKVQNIIIILKRLLIQLLKNVLWTTVRSSYSLWWGLRIFGSATSEHTFAVHNGTSSDSNGEDYDNSNSNNNGRSSFFNNWICLNRGWGFVNLSSIGLITSLVEITSFFRTAVSKLGCSTRDLHKSFLVFCSSILKHSSSEDSISLESRR